MKTSVYLLKLSCLIDCLRPLLKNLFIFEIKETNLQCVVWLGFANGSLLFVLQNTVAMRRLDIVAFVAK